MRRTRRLAAILVADIAGYTRLMRTDESGTLDWWWHARAQVIDPAISSHGGRIVKHTGDGFLAEFFAPTDAVSCGVEIQTQLAPPERAKPAHEQILFRMGINVGEVVADDEDIYGDDVNVAARIESLAHPGSIAVSQNVFEQVHDKLSVSFSAVQTHQVKNIVEPLAIHHVDLGPAPASSDTAIPDSPTLVSMAVLPFTNHSGAGESGILASGMTEDIITALSKYRWFQIISHSSTESLRQRAVSTREVGREFGVRYVLEGSVRQAGQRLRISATLSEAETARTIWSERYVRQLEDLFDLQDEMTRTIATAVEPRILAIERVHAARKRTEDLQAWDLFHRGAQAYARYDREGLTHCEHLMHQCIECDPRFAAPYGYLGLTAFAKLSWGWADDRNQCLREGIDAARAGIERDRHEFYAYLALGRLTLVKGDPHAARDALQTAVDLNPNYPYGYYGLAAVRAHLEDWHGVIESAELALQRGPLDPLAWGYLSYVAIGHAGSGAYARAAFFMDRAERQSGKQWVTPMYLAVFLVCADAYRDGAAALERAKTLEPELNLGRARAAVAIHAPALEPVVVDALRTLGLSE